VAYDIRALDASGCRLFVCDFDIDTPATRAGIDKVLSVRAREDLQV
jgi:hypothetical protein